MTIDRVFNTEKRMRAAWFDSTPPADGRKAFEERGFQVTSCSTTDLQDSDFLAGLAAVVFTQSEAHLQGITQDLNTHGQRLLDYGCLVIIRACDKPDLYSQPMRIIGNAVNSLQLWIAGLPPREAEKLKAWQPVGCGEPPLPHARVYGLNVEWSRIANFLTEHPPGPAPSLTLTIDTEDETPCLPSGYEILLRRAFWNCTEVHLKRMDDGNSGVSVYLAYPELAKGQNGQLGQWPLPYFLKIGDRKKIFDEYVNYEDNVDPYIPFHLGPHLISERCCLGAHVGVIVGDYVEESESLVECARNGRAGPAIACLFNRTLAGWHRGAQENEEESTQLGKSFLGRFPRQKKNLDARMARARELGATRELDELRGLFQRCNSTPVLVGAIHGDLHAGNVRVRSTDAIVIDFTAHRRGPLVDDAAKLEASLMVDGFDEGKKYAREKMSKIEIERLDSDIRKWLKSIESLYDHIPLEQSLIHPNPKNRSCWFHSCVRQIRLYARQMESGEHQYAASLALALLDKFKKDLQAEEPEASRRAAAYVLAERVLVNTFNPEQKE